MPAFTFQENLFLSHECAPACTIMLVLLLTVFLHHVGLKDTNMYLPSGLTLSVLLCVLVTYTSCIHKTQARKRSSQLVQ
uniref:Uncharacterized protein n=1 Tax=Arundo donax TaxID=35708 RepID=A0A0A9C891_ARUDO